MYFNNIGNTAKKMRTIDSAYKEIKSIDPDSAISKNLIRTIVLNEKIPVTHQGAKRIFDLDDLFSYFGMN